ncbi:hypothetical protein E4U21_002915 [Claviceps maximensis]|nr:hypothetical protein E4U21_002915 [Claviceps maximensis]
MTTTDVLHAYRHLYRNLLRAVQYAAPARYIARDQLRRAFRQAPPAVAAASSSSSSSSSPSFSLFPSSPTAVVAAPAPSLNTEGIKRTIWFLEAAAKERGLEHKILKNLLRVQGQRTFEQEVQWKRVLTKSKKREEDAAYRHYDRTVRMLNESMGLCLR